MIMGAEAVARGWSEGDTELVVTGLFLLLLLFLGWWAWRRWGVVARQRFLHWQRAASQNREEEEFGAEGVELGSFHPYLSPERTIAPLPHLDGTLGGGKEPPL